MDFLKKILKNKIIIIVIAILVVLLVLVLIFVNKGEKEVNQFEQLSSSLKELGVNFYEDFYYKQIGQTDSEKEEFLEKYKDIGIKISLDSLSRHNKEKTEEILAEFVNSQTQEACDVTKSQVVIYPREPYGKTDYSIDAVLVCGFEETEIK